MKKRIIGIVVLSMIITSVLGACSKGSEGTSTATATAEYDYKEYIDLADYKNMPYYTEEFEATEEEVNEQIEMILLYATEMETVTEGVVEDGDNINVAFVGKIDGEEFEGGTSESYDITVGTTTMIDGFVEGLIGKKIGETVTLNLKFPDDYHSTELQGKDVVFDVTINSKNISKTPELTDDFVKTYYEAENVDAFKEQIKNDIINEKKSSFESTLKNNLWTVILDKTQIKSYPEEELAIAQEQVDQIEQSYRDNAESYGLEWADFLTTLMGTDEEGFAARMEEYKDSIIKNNMVSAAIAKEEGISLSDSEYKNRIKEILEENSLTEEAFQNYYNMSIYDYAEENGWRDSILMDMVLDKVVELGKEVSKDEYDKYMEENLPVEEHDHDHDHDEDAETETAEAEDAEATEGEAEETEEETKAEG